MDYFEIFGLPRRLCLDERALQRQFYELSRQHHPDFHQGEPPDVQARALTVSALVNTAYRALRDPIRRIEYLVRLEQGGDGKVADAIGPKAAPGLLAEMFEIQEALQEAKTGPLDQASRLSLLTQRDALARRYDAEEGRLRGALAQAWDAASPEERPARLAALREALGTRAYLRTVIDDLNQILEEEQEPHVAHHRH